MSSQALEERLSTMQFVGLLNRTVGIKSVISLVDVVEIIGVPPVLGFLNGQSSISVRLFVGA